MSRLNVDSDETFILFLLMNKQVPTIKLKMPLSQKVALRMC